MTKEYFFRNTAHSEALKLNESFDFKCRDCGNCCKGNTNHTLTGYDVYRIAKHFDTSTKEVIEKYCHWDTSNQNSLLPVLFMNYGENGYCQLYGDGKCTVHSSKPVFCAILPLNMRLNYEEGIISYTIMDRTEMPPKCKYESEYQVVNDWLADFQISENDPNIISWYNTLIKIINTPLTANMQDALKGALYTNFDIKKVFSEQLVANLNGVLFEKL